MKVVPIPLAVPQPQERIVKRGASLAFRTLFAIAEQAKKAPGLIKQAADDVRDAWQETARPNA
ncbi:MAG: hypothetical protein IPJ52_12320 [Rhodocyclaceae bacterium]|nr:hypothetical protein [Rhodocyclaceae bacterium]